MNEESFWDYTLWLEEKSIRHPLLFKIRVLLILLSGYINISFLLLLAAFVGLVGYATFFFNPIVFLGFAAFSAILFYYGIVTLIRIASIKFQKPEGMELKYEDSPVLFNRIDEFRRKLRIPKIHRVLIDCDMNAMAAQVPLSGIFGFYRNYLGRCISSLPRNRSAGIVQK